jgi:alkyl hydroperoxide reductase subunit AhpF
MSARQERPQDSIFAGESWSQLIGFLEKLPRPVKLVVWADEDGGRFEKEALHLARSLAARFDALEFEHRDRVPNHYHYPVIGFMGLEEEEAEVDFRVRMIGLPAGYQINSLVGAIQAVSFRASNLEGITRIKLSKLPAEMRVDLEVFTAAENEAGALVATLAAGLAVASPQVRAFVVMADVFPDVAMRYSVRNLPHTVINGRVHAEGALDEVGILRQIAIAVRQDNRA